MNGKSGDGDFGGLWFNSRLKPSTPAALHSRFILVR